MPRQPQHACDDTSPACPTAVPPKPAASAPAHHQAPPWSRPPSGVGWGASRTPSWPQSRSTSGWWPGQTGWCGRGTAPAGPQTTAPCPPQSSSAPGARCWARRESQGAGRAVQRLGLGGGRPGLSLRRGPDVWLGARAFWGLPAGGLPALPALLPAARPCMLSAWLESHTSSRCCHLKVGELHCRNDQDERAGPRDRPRPAPSSLPQHWHRHLVQPAGRRDARQRLALPHPHRRQLGAAPLCLLGRPAQARCPPARQPAAAPLGGRVRHPCAGRGLQRCRSLGVGYAAAAATAAAGDDRAGRLGCPAGAPRPRWRRRLPSCSG